MIKPREKDIKSYAYKLISIKSRSENELRIKLQQKGYTDSVIYELIESLQSAGVIDDRALARDIVDYACQSKFLGLHGCKEYLKKRGISRDIIDEIHFPFDAEIEKAKKLLEKKHDFLAKYNGINKARKVYELLTRRGFGGEVISELVKEV